jgi:DNA-binding protein YbaB
MKIKRVLTKEEMYASRRRISRIMKEQAIVSNYVKVDFNCYPFITKVKIYPNIVKIPNVFLIIILSFLKKT